MAQDTRAPRLLYLIPVVLVLLALLFVLHPQWIVGWGDNPNSISTSAIERFGLLLAALAFMVFLGLLPVARARMPHHPIDDEGHNL